MRLAVCAFLAVAAAYPQGPGTFELLGKYKGLGGLVASAVAPGPTPGSQRLYLSYLYIDNTIDVVAVDPATGDFRVFQNPAPGESGARCIAVGPDGNVYLGTLSKAHLLKLDTRAQTLTDLGRPAASEQYIWDVAFGPDGKLYGATYPESKLVRYDPRSGRLEDLGRMDPVEQYAHSVVGAGDFMYVGIGTSKANIAAYQISTGEHREILPADAQVVGQATVYRGEDGKLYGTIAGRHFRLEGWSCTPVPEAPKPERTDRLADGRTVAAEGHFLKITDPKTGAASERRFAYDGNTLPLFRIAFAADGELYGSSVLPIHIVKYDRASHTLPDLGDLGGGEIYSFLARGKQYLMAGYGSYAPLFVYDPARPWSDQNPKRVDFPGSDHGWRPQAMINGPGGRVYLGSVAGYGRLGGPLTVWDVESGKVDQYHHLIRDQSVISLAAWKDRIVGGTTTGGGGGSHPTQKEAVLFLWNPETRAKEFETVPVPGARSINDLIAAPNGLVYGLAGRTLFVFDPVKREVVERKPFPVFGSVYNSVAMGPDGRIWGLAPEGIFAIDTKTNEAALVAKAPEKITGGFDLRDGAIYFISGPAVYRYTLPKQ